MPSNLERRFLTFLAALPGSESLDDLLGGERYAGERRADYLLFGRRIIVELKTLKTDTSLKVKAEMDQYRERDDFPVFYGEVELQNVLKHLSDGEKINKRIYLRTTRSVEDAVRSAEDQILNTAKLLRLPESLGLLVMLNQDITIFTPEVLATRVAMLMHRTNEDGLPRSPIAVAWLILESHKLKAGPIEKNFPMVNVEGPLAVNAEWFQELLSYLQVAWAQFNGAPLFHHGSSDLASFQVTPSAESAPSKPADQLTRQDFWESVYRESPYLRRMSDEEVLAVGRKAIDNVRPHFIVGGSRASPKKMEEMMRAWSDFLCEARYRGLDLRSLRAR